MNTNRNQVGLPGAPATVEKLAFIRVHSRLIFPLLSLPPRLRGAHLIVVLLALSSPSLASNLDLTVRLYSLHQEPRVRLKATHAAFRWKSCRQCPPKQAAELSVEADGESVKIQTADETARSVKEAVIEGDYRIEPAEGFRLSLAFPLRIKSSHGRLVLLLSVPLEEYVAAALAGESGSFEQPESRKAMAVAVRTYAVRFRPRHEAQGFDFCDSTHCQTLNFKAIGPQARAAAEATRGQMLWYEGRPAATFYHQNCGGKVAAAGEAWPDLAAPYLPGHDDPYCIRATPLPWKARLDRGRLEKALRDQGLRVPEGWRSLEVRSRAPSGRARDLVFRGGAGPEQRISASSLRFAIGRAFGWNEVRSDLYEVETTADAVIFTGRGGGHGVGLCQAGAEQMAREGKNYKEILAFYYPGTSLGLTAASGIHWRKLEGARFELLSPQPDKDSDALATAEKILPALESDLDWRLDFHPQLKVYPTLDAYRNSTGQPGWIAAFTRGSVISLQPAETLRRKSIMEPTLRHELAHLLIEAQAHPGTPLWFREGLALYLAGTRKGPVIMSDAEMEEAMRHSEDRWRIERAYAAAATRVTKMIERSGKNTVLEWLRQGLPGGHNQRRTTETRGHGEKQKKNSPQIRADQR